MKRFLIIPLLVLCSSKALFAETFSDDMGRLVEIKENPSRIVSLAPHITEILFALDLGKKVVGVTQYSDYPEEARNKERVGSYVKLNLEKIVSLSPDLVLATADGNPKAVVDRLGSIGIPVYVVNAGGIKDIYGNIRSIGIVTGKSKKADLIAEKLENRINSVVDKVKKLARPRVFIQLGYSPLYTAGKNTFVDDLITLAGGKNIAGKEKISYPVYSTEELLNKEPEVVFSVLMGSEVDIKTDTFWNQWHTLPAVRDGRIYYVDPDIVNRPSPRIAAGLELLARKLHPGVFEDSGGKGDK
ncbi:MAG: cobalamin-binding protein [bacterium]|nr:cobalamin-binding protein [bacterium]